MKPLTFFCVFLIVALAANSQTLSWAKQIGGASDEYGSSIVVDRSGNVYTTGQFNGTADFDPGPGTFNMTSAGYNDIFVTKLNSSGNFVWAKQMGGTSYDAGTSIAVDASGNIYVTGNFSGTVDIDPGTGTSNLVSAGGLDIFICNLDQSGNFKWGKSFGASTDEDHGNAITVDASGNVYTTGSFKETVDFDPGPAAFNLTADYIDVFVSKLDSSGNFAWAKKMGGLFYEYGYDIATDASGNVYITGSFRGLNCDFDPGPGTFYLNTFGDTDEFICKLGSSGNFIWAKQFTAPAYYYSDGYSIAVDTSGHIYTAGRFHGQVDFDPGPATFTMKSTGLNDGFICKLDSSGGFMWAKIVGGCQNQDYASSIALDDSANVYITGQFSYIGDFDPGPGTFNLTSAGNFECFISKFATSGNFVSAIRLGGTSNDHGASIALDASANIYTTGYFGGVADFDPGPGTLNLSSAGGADVFVHKIIQRLQQPALSTVDTEYCSAIGIQTFKLLNLPDTSRVSVVIKVDTTILSLAPDSSFSISMHTLTPGSHRIEVRYSNAAESKTTTKDFTVIAAQTPDVNITASATTVTNLDPVTITAINASGGGTVPLFTFGKDKSMSNIWQTESANSVLVLDPSNLSIGQNRIYVRMKTSVSCYTNLDNVDSIDITRTVTTGIRDIDYPNQEIVVYPIPFNQSLDIKGLQISKSYLISVSNSIGQIIFQKHVRGSAEVKMINIGPAGNYWLCIFDKTKMRRLGSIPLIKY